MSRRFPGRDCDVHFACPDHGTQLPVIVSHTVGPNLAERLFSCHGAKWTVLIATDGVCTCPPILRPAEGSA